jgi:hypothetical protein
MITMRAPRGLGDGHCVGHWEDFEARSHCEQEIGLLRCLHGAVDDCGHQLPACQ